jgi:proline iminopeptidase
VSGLLDVGDGHRIFWEAHGDGTPALVVHGGPGSGCGLYYLEFFDMSLFRVVLVDQRSCGKSRPHASDPATDLGANTTAHLVEDFERVREHLGIERWLVLGGSWGSTLALAYAEAHPERVSALVVFGVSTGRHSEFDWLFRGGVSLFFPQQWERLAAHVGDAPDVPAAYYTLLNDPDPAVRRAATEEWIRWESATPSWPPREGISDRFLDTDFAYSFARLVTHYVQANAWLEDGELLRPDILERFSGAIVNGRFDFQSPLGNAWALHRVWPRAELTVVDDAGHSMTPATIAAVRAATDRFSRT